MKDRGMRIIFRLCSRFHGVAVRETLRSISRNISWRVVNLSTSASLVLSRALEAGGVGMLRGDMTGATAELMNLRYIVLSR